MATAPLICDSQVHAPDIPGLLQPRYQETLGPQSSGIGRDELVREMLAAGVTRAILVPVAGHNEECVRWAVEEPDRFAVMGGVALDRGPQPEEVATVRERGMLGVRVSFFAPAARSIFLDGGLEWLWAAADSGRVPVMVNAVGVVEQLGSVAVRYPGLRIVVDHMGLTPLVHYTDFDVPLRPLLSLAKLPNVAVKASGLPRSVGESFPFSSLHKPIRQVIDAFGAERVFWGSDLTTLPCSYADSLRLFSEALPRSDAELELILGAALCDWLGWTRSPSPNPVGGAGHCGG